MTNLVYDPARQGLDTTIIKAITNTPELVGNVIRLTYATSSPCDMAFLEDVTFGWFESLLTIPTNPTTGDNREWGLSQIGSGAKLHYQINNDVFTFEINDGKGNTKSTTLVWDQAWENTPVNFGFIWTPGEIILTVNGDRIGVTIHDKSVPNTPMYFYFMNGTADNMDLSLVTAKNVEFYLSHK